MKMKKIMVTSTVVLLNLVTTALSFNMDFTWDDARSPVTPVHRFTLANPLSAADLADQGSMLSVGGSFNFSGGTMGETAPLSGQINGSYCWNLHYLFLETALSFELGAAIYDELYDDTIGTTISSKSNRKTYRYFAPELRLEAIKKVSVSDRFSFLFGTGGGFGYEFGEYIKERDSIALREEEIVEGGAFSTSCNFSISEQFTYPKLSWGLFQKVSFNWYLAGDEVPSYYFYMVETGVQIAPLKRHRVHFSFGTNFAERDSMLGFIELAMFSVGYTFHIPGFSKVK